MTIHSGQIAFVSIGCIPSVWVFDSEEEADRVESEPLGDLGCDGRDLYLTKYGVGSFHRVIRNDVMEDDLVEMYQAQAQSVKGVSP